MPLANHHRFRPKELICLRGWQVAVSPREKKYRSRLPPASFSIFHPLSSILYPCFSPRPA